jgi:hypothetical protein
LNTAISKPENAIFNKFARGKAKQPQLKNQLTKSHESSLPTIGRDKTGKIGTTLFIPLQR